MNLDDKLTTGILVGVILGLHYHTDLTMYLPVLVVATLIMLLKTLRYPETK